MSILRKFKEEGIRLGIQKGIQQGFKQAAVRMYQAGVSIDIIEKGTGLSKKQILKMVPKSV